MFSYSYTYPSMFICPGCKSVLVDVENQAVFCGCGRSYSHLPSGGLDFLQGEEFPDFHLDPSDRAQQELLEQKAAGVAWRIEEFIVPLIARYSGASGKLGQPLTVLDCGCGNGVSVDMLRAYGMRAWGIDAGRARHQQWPMHSFRRCLHSANALHLPFANSSFDVVLSCGLIEHIGIHEEESNGYVAWRLPDCHAQRQQFIAELVRVVKHEGFILVDHPNGGSPADFWHGGKPGSIRWHALKGDMLPRFDEIVHYFRAADPSLHLYSLSPYRRLRFNQVRNHWYGRAFASLMKAWLRTMAIPALSFLARSFLNPYLVTVATRRPYEKLTKMRVSRSNLQGSIKRLSYPSASRRFIIALGGKGSLVLYP